jgi:hypothetical protein
VRSAFVDFSSIQYGMAVLAERVQYRGARRKAALGFARVEEPTRGLRDLKHERDDEPERPPSGSRPFRPVTSGIHQRTK